MNSVGTGCTCASYRSCSRSACNIHDEIFRVDTAHIQYLLHEFDGLLVVVDGFSVGPLQQIGTLQTTLMMNRAVATGILWVVILNEVQLAIPGPSKQEKLVIVTKPGPGGSSGVLVPRAELIAQTFVSASL